MNIREKRIAKGLLQKDVLKDTSLLSKIENGKAIACPKDAKRMAVLFECEPRELFTGEESAFFGKTFVGVKVTAGEEKNENRAICKPERTIRKCFRLDRGTNEAFSDAVRELGFKTAQEWFLKAVDETITQVTGAEEKNYCNSDYMGREEISQ